MSENFKRVIYSIVTVSIIFLVATLFIKILPWLLLVGLIAYFLIKVISFIKGKKSQKDKEESNSDNRFYDQEDSYNQAEDFTGEIIDVDYEEVDKKED